MNIFAPIEAADRVEAAARLIAAGRLGEAEAFLDDVLRRQPGHPDALNTLASLSLSRHDAEGAMAVLGPACTAHPDHARLLANLGLAHFMLGRPQDAALCLERAVANAPDDHRMRLAWAQYLTASGDLPRALAAIRSVLRAAPAHIEALAQLGATSTAAGDLIEGETALRKAAALDPDRADVLGNLSVLCGLTGRHAEADILAERACLQAPLDLGRQMQLAACRAMLGEFDSAADLCKRILVTAPNHLAATQLFGRIAIAHGAVDSGVSTLSHVVRRRPGDPDAILALAGALRFAGRMTQALTFVDQALGLVPEHRHGQALKTDLLLSLGRFAEAWDAPRPAAADRPQVVVVPNGLTLTDAILFGRFIADLGGGVALLSEADLAVGDLLSHLTGVDLGRKAEPDQRAVMLQAIPLVLGSGATGVRRKQPYLTPDVGRSTRWRAAFAPLARPLIGVDWDEFRPGVQMRDLAASVRGSGTLVSFATGSKRHQLRDWPEPIDVGAHINDSADLVAAIACLDAVVSTDSVLLHVAGALALPGVAIAPAGYPWALAPDGERLLWHSSLRRIAQRAPGRWDDVVAEVYPALLAELAGRAE